MMAVVNFSESCPSRQKLSIRIGKLRSKFLTRKAYLLTPVSFLVQLSTLREESQLSWVSSADQSASLAGIDYLNAEFLLPTKPISEIGNVESNTRYHIEDEKGKLPQLIGNRCLIDSVDSLLSMKSSCFSLLLDSGKSLILPKLNACGLGGDTVANFDGSVVVSMFRPDAFVRRMKVLIDYGFVDLTRVFNVTESVHAIGGAADVLIDFRAYLNRSSDGSVWFVVPIVKKDGTIVERSLFIGQLLFAFQNHSKYIPVVLDSPRLWENVTMVSGSEKLLSVLSHSRFSIDHPVFDIPGKQLLNNPRRQTSLAVSSLFGANDITESKT
ncbi:hypothetical protein Nepgr_001801 [Nepenthes gracilis]|uniref:Conserved oligomeric Golgi complex subunit 1 n=1 Tax=Nepenthes gracilis TaxID=150966 RepID=A0AAD3P949_NEPGR|nr:hypothetical protein Nepgr_001801 [Nepenthes gracilis]